MSQAPIPATASDESIRVRVEATPTSRLITLDRPGKLNALDASLVEQLIAAVSEAIDAGVPVIAFRGEGRNFSAGFDFGRLDVESEGDLLHRFVRIECLLQRVASAPAITVAFAHGRNFGAGVDLFAACRYRYAAPGATFRMPGLAFGVVLGTRRFARIVGATAATSILGAQQTFDAEQGRSLGFVNDVMEEAQWSACMAEHAAQASSLSPASRRALLDVLADGDLDRDMADLARSVSAPGLKTRVRAYLASRNISR